MKKASDLFSIIFENDNFLAINKEKNLSTQKNIHYSSSVEEILKEIQPFSFLERSGIVHRIDRNTTGILIIAKNKNYQKKLISLFKEKKIEKKYLSLNFGTLKKNSGIIKLFLKKTFSSKKIRMNLGNLDDNFVEISFEKASESNRLTLFKVKALTGKTHQIRLAFETIGLPLYNDELYNANSPRDFFYNNEGHYLHSYYINFFDGEENFELLADLPNVFLDTINKEGIKITDKEILSLLPKEKSI